MPRKTRPKSERKKKKSIKKNTILEEVPPCQKCGGTVIKNGDEVYRCKLCDWEGKPQVQPMLV